MKQFFNIHYTNTLYWICNIRLCQNFQSVIKHNKTCTYYEYRKYVHYVINFNIFIQNITVSFTWFIPYALYSIQESKYVYLTSPHDHNPLFSTDNGNCKLKADMNKECFKWAITRCKYHQMFLVWNLMSSNAQFIFIKPKSKHPKRVLNKEKPGLFVCHFMQLNIMIIKTNIKWTELTKLMNT
jgi:hypothetical protein